MICMVLKLDTAQILDNWSDWTDWCLWSPYTAVDLVFDLQVIGEMVQIRNTDIFFMYFLEMFYSSAPKSWNDIRFS